ncbi:MAG: hypothetical protein RBT59_06630 [Arcobacteraceae bacterium]|jgi:hypothetical protein|nr:hypothetical protein [Arcobacteraceae bacterium]
MNNNKLSTGIEEIDKIFQGGIPAGQFAFLYASNKQDDIRTFTFPKNRDNKISLSVEFIPRDMKLIKKIENNPQIKLRESLEYAINRKKDILDSAFKEAVKYKLGDFKLEDLKDRAVLQIQGDIQNLYIDGERLLVVYDNNSLLEPLILKLYGKSK